MGQHDVATAQNGQNTNSVKSNMHIDMSPGASSSFATAVTVMASPGVGNSDCSRGTMVPVSHPADDTTSQASSVVSPLSAKAVKEKKGSSARRPRGSPSLSPPSLLRQSPLPRVMSVPSQVHAQDRRLQLHLAPELSTGSLAHAQFSFKLHICTVEGAGAMSV